MNEDDPIYSKKLQDRKKPKIEETETKAANPSSPNEPSKITEDKPETTSKNDESKKQDDTNNFNAALEAIKRMKAQ